MTLTRPDGSVTQLATSSGQSATWSLANATEGLYVVRGTLTAGGSSDGRPLPLHGLGAAGDRHRRVAAARAEERRAVRGRRAPELRREHDARLADRRLQRLGRRRDRAGRRRARVSGLPAGSLVVNVSAFLRSTHAPVHDLGGVADIRFMNAGSGAHPVDLGGREDVARHPAAADAQPPGRPGRRLVPRLRRDRPRARAPPQLLRARRPAGLDAARDANHHRAAAVARGPLVHRRAHVAHGACARDRLVRRAGRLDRARARRSRLPPATRA